MVLNFPEKISIPDVFSIIKFNILKTYKEDFSSQGLNQESFNCRRIPGWKVEDIFPCVGGLESGNANISDLLEIQSQISFQVLTKHLDECLNRKLFTYDGIFDLYLFTFTCSQTLM